jgi:hypothetical protein
MSSRLKKPLLLLLTLTLLVGPLQSAIAKVDVSNQSGKETETCAMHDKLAIADTSAEYAEAISKAHVCGQAGSCNHELCTSASCMSQMLYLKNFLSSSLAARLGEKASYLSSVVANMFGTPLHKPPRA